MGCIYIDIQKAVKEEICEDCGNIIKPGIKFFCLYFEEGFNNALCLNCGKIKNIRICTCD